MENKLNLEPRIAALLNDEELKLFNDAKVKRQICVTKIRQLAHDSGLPTEQFIAMDAVIQQTWIRASDAVRINYQVGGWLYGLSYPSPATRYMHIIIIHMCYNGLMIISSPNCCCQNEFS